MNEPIDPMSRDQAAEPEDGERGPVGTLFVLLLYLMALAGMWATLYWLLLSR